jgi:transcriptional regulator with XRE-family HTH domain
VAAKPKHRRLLGEAIRLHRKSADLTQEKLAERADLHPNYIGEVERGEKTISIDALLRIARSLDVKLRELVKEL